jgi:hypothetical protein
MYYIGQRCGQLEHGTGHVQIYVSLHTAVTMSTYTSQKKMLTPLWHYGHDGKAYLG